MAASSIGRRTRYAVIAVEKLRAISALDDKEVVAANEGVDKDMIDALEQMVNAAKAGRLKGDSILALGAAAWR